MAEDIAVRVKVVDARKLAADLKAADGRTPKELRVANARSAEIAVRRARQLAPKGVHQGGGHPLPLASAIHVQASASHAYIVFGGARAPHGPVVNFGGTVPRYHSVTKTRVRRQEHIYTAIAQTAPQRKDEYEKAITRIVHSLL